MSPYPSADPPAFRRDRVTWMLYAMLAWFAYLQAAPGLVVPRLREESGFGYTVAGLHVAAFAAGTTVAGALSPRLGRVLGRSRLLWAGGAVLGVGTVLLAVVPPPAGTIAAIAVMGVGGGLVLATVQVALADHHPTRRAVALTEANVAAAASYVLLTAALLLAAALGLGWRGALLASLVVPLGAGLATRGRLAGRGAPEHGRAGGRLPGAFWVAALMLMCATAAEWCIGAWGATFVQQSLDSSADAAVAVMTGYFGGVLGGRLLGSRLTRRHDPGVLFGVALGLALAGFAVVWSSGGAARSALGMVLLGIGLGNLFPMGLSLAVSLAPDRTAAASGALVSLTSSAILLAPLTVGTLADATSLSAALGVVPVLIGCAGVALAVVRRARPPVSG